MSEQTCRCCEETFPSPFTFSLCKPCRQAGCEDMADEDLCAAKGAESGEQAGLTEFGQ